MPVRVTNTPFSIIDGSAAITDEVVVVGGWDGTHVRSLKTNTTGAAVVDLNGAVVKVDPESRVFNVEETTRENGEVTVLTSATRIAAAASTTLTLAKQKGLMLYLNVTAAPTSVSERLRVVVSAVDPVSGGLFELTGFASSPASDSTTLASPVLFAFAVYPGAPAGSGNLQSASVALPRTVNIAVTHSGTNPWTYSLGASILL